MSVCVHVRVSVSVCVCVCVCVSVSVRESVWECVWGGVTSGKWRVRRTSLESVL